MDRRLGMPRPFRTSGKGGVFDPQWMPKNLNRRYGQKDLHFITCSCCRRLPLVRSVWARNLFVEILDEVRGQYGFTVMGYETRRESKTPPLQIKGWGTHAQFPERAEAGQRMSHPPSQQELGWVDSIGSGRIRICQS